MTASLIVIPARMGATRLPNKPLADIDGLPMVVQVMRRAVAANAGPVVVATDAREIIEAVEAHGGEAVMTRSDHPSGSDRVQEAAAALVARYPHEIVVNVQGDLPTLSPAAVLAAIGVTDDPAVDIGTACAPITDPAEYDDPAVVKIAATQLSPTRLHAHYFSRSRVPSGEGVLYHHLGIYAWRPAALARFVALPPSALELRERLEQLRALAVGMRIDVGITSDIPISVDTPADLERARAAFAAMKGAR